jgi:monoamine oxidase
MASSTSPSVLIIGGGMAGLTAACELHERNIDVLVLEASHRLGGRTESVTTKLGSRLDIGGQWIGADHHRLKLLAAQAQSTTFKTHNKGLPVLIHRNRRLSVLNPSILLGVVIVGVFDLMCRIGVPQSWNAVSIEKAIATVAPTAITKRFLEVLTTLSAAAELAQTSIYAFAKSVPLSGGMVTMLSAQGGAQDSLITESVGSVVDMLASRLGSGRLRTDTRVVGIEQTDDGVVVRAQSGEVFRAAKVIVAVPPPMLTSISFQPTLPEERLRLQKNTQMGVVYKAIAVFETPFWRDRFGGECIVLDDPPRGIFDSSSPSDEGPGHLCVLVGGSPARMLDGMSPQARIDLLLGPLIELLGPEVLKPVEWHEKAWHGDEFCGGGYMAMSKIDTLEGLMPMPHERIGDVHWAGTETAAEHSGYIEGAVESGQRAAREIVL